ncbi:MAG: WG repeat-containing protein [Clostridia bacterium]|nr:WG repeat-containing protein [Clostridia bacterium]
MKRLFALLLALTLIFCACAEEKDENIIRLQTDPPTYLQFNETTREWDLYDETGIIGSNYHIYYYGQEESAYLVRHKDKYGYLSLDGRWIFEPQFDDAFFFSDGIACVVVDGLLGFINIDGQYIIEPRFDDALYFNDGLCAVTEDGEKWGFIDKQGNWAI